MPLVLDPSQIETETKDLPPLATGVIVLQQPDSEQAPIHPRSEEPQGFSKSFCSLLSL